MLMLHFCFQRFMKQKVPFLSFLVHEQIFFDLPSHVPCAESCCSIWLNCLSGSMQTDNCLDPPAHKLESTRLFVQGLSLFTCWKSFLKVIWPFLRENRNCLRKITVLLFCIHVAHKLPGPSWKRQSTISRFCWKNFPRLVPNHR